MDNTEELDYLIKKYSGELIRLGEQYGYNLETPDENPTDESEDEGEALQENNEIETDTQENEQSDSSDGNLYYRQQESAMPENITVETEEEDKEKEISPYPLTNPENYATFKAVVLSAGGAFPVPDAKVSLKRKGELHAFLVTNGSGETKTVKIEAYPEENSLEPLNPDKQMFYTADIKADGFEDKTDLPVYATGGSQIILQEYLVPTGGM